MLIVELVGWCLVWSKAYTQCLSVCLLVLEPLGRGCSAGHRQPRLVLGLGPPDRRYKVICTWLLLVLDLEVPGRGFSVNQG